LGQIEEKTDVIGFVFELCLQLYNLFKELFIDGLLRFGNGCVFEIIEFLRGKVEFCLEVDEFRLDYVELIF
jgi:hypothetical protein